MSSNNIPLKLLRGYKNNLPTTIEDGMIYYCIDSNELFFDYVNNSTTPPTEHRYCLNPMVGETNYGDPVGKGLVSPEDKEIIDTAVRFVEQHLEPEQQKQARLNIDAVGEKTLEGGEIFNDYENNVAFSYAHAEGLMNVATGENSHAEGHNTTAAGLSAHSEGEGLGYTTLSSAATAGSNTFTVNNLDNFEIERHIVLNNETKKIIAIDSSTMTVTVDSNLSNYSAEGTVVYLSGATGDAAHSEGLLTLASGYASHAEGQETLAMGRYSHAKNYKTQALGAYSSAEGSNTVASGDISHAEGEQTESTGYGAHAEGGLTLASGTMSHAEGENTIASEYASHAEGCETEASGRTSHAEGYQTKTYGEASHAEGYGTKAYEKAHAEGRSSIAEGEGSHAEGYSTHAEGEYSHTEGENSVASGYVSHSEGGSTIAEGNYSHAEGYKTLAMNNRSHAEGYKTFSAGISSHAENQYAVAAGDYSHSEGKGLGHSTVVGNLSIGDITITVEDLVDLEEIDSDLNNYIYLNNKAYEIDSIDIINSSITIKEGLSEEINEGTYIYYSGSFGIVSHTEGNETIAIGRHSHAEGNNTRAIGDDSHTEGRKTLATGDYSHAEGYYSVASGIYGAHAEGNYTIASGDSSHAEGGSTIAYGEYSHAEGVSDNFTSITLSGEKGTTLYTYESRIYSDDVGSILNFNNIYTTILEVDTNNKTVLVESTLSEEESLIETPVKMIAGIAYGYCSHIEGANNIASGNYSHAEGMNTKAFNSSSHAEGTSTKASGYASHAEGESTIANGDYSHTEGQNTIASGYASHAEGQETAASGYTSHAEGTNVQVTGDYSHGEGINNKATGNSSHVEGAGSRAIGDTSHAEGNTRALGDYSHTEGAGTSFIKKITGEANATVYTLDSSLAGRYYGYGILLYNNNFAIITDYDPTTLQITVENTVSSEALNNVNADICLGAGYGEFSHTEGFENLTYGKYQHVGGKYNIPDKTNAIIIGNGNSTNRSNAHTLDWEGNAWFAGDVYVGGTSMDNATKLEAAKPYMTKITLTASDWNTTTLTQVATIAGIKADETAQAIYINPVFDDTMIDEIGNCNVYASAQGENSITFSCDSIPTIDVEFYVKWQDVIWVAPPLI